MVQFSMEEPRSILGIIVFFLEPVSFVKYHIVKSTFKGDREMAPQLRALTGLAEYLA